MSHAEAPKKPKTTSISNLVGYSSVSGDEQRNLKLAESISTPQRPRHHEYASHPSLPHPFPPYPTPYRTFVTPPAPEVHYPTATDPSCFHGIQRQLYEMQDVIAGLRHENHMLHQENYNLSNQIQSLLDYQQKREEDEQRRTSLESRDLKAQIDLALKDWMPIMEQSIRSNLEEALLTRNKPSLD